MLYLVALVFLLPRVDAMEPLGSSFSYQGYLQLGGTPAHGLFDFEFRLFDAETGGLQVGPTVQTDEVAVVDGIFSTALDFGPIGSELRWLEIKVRERELPAEAFTMLVPRQPILPTPYSQFALQAGLATNSDRLDGKDSSEFLSTSDGTLTGDLQINGALSVNTLSVDGVPFEPTPAVTTPTIYSPATLTCGTAGEMNFATWGSIAAGTFRLTIEDGSHDIAVNFVGVGSMVEVADRIEAAIRGVTGGQERAQWLGDHFVLESGDTTVNSSIGQLDPHSAGTPIDISGHGATKWMDCSDGAVTDTRLDISAFAGHVVRLNGGGRFDSRFLPPPSSAVIINKSISLQPGETKVLELPTNLANATRYRMYYRLNVRVGTSNTSGHHVLNGIAEGVFGGRVLDISSVVINGSSSEATAAQLTWGLDTFPSAGFRPLSSNPVMQVGSVDFDQGKVKIAVFLGPSNARVTSSFNMLGMLLTE